MPSLVSITVPPTMLWCVGRNYVDHIHELGNEIPDDMVIFAKPGAALSDELVAVRGEPIHFEAELCLLMGTSGISHVGLGLDLTKRGLQSQLKSKGLPWERAKAFAGAALLTEFVELSPATRWSQVAFSLHVDDRLQQDGRCELMMYAPDVIVETLSRDFPLRAGDVIMTGTPAGVGEVVAGSRYRLTLAINGVERVSQSWEAR